MKYILLFCFALVATCLELTDENFEKLTQASSGSTSGIHVVMFFANWCPICQKLKPVFEEAAHLLENDVEENPLGAVMDTVDVEFNPRLKQRFNVERYPTIIVFKNGKHSTYDGFQNRKELLSFVQSGILDIIPSQWKIVPAEPGWIQDQLVFFYEDTVFVLSSHGYGSLVVFISGVLLGVLIYNQFCYTNLRSKVKES